MTRTTATSAMSPPDSELSGMCFLQAVDGRREACVHPDRRRVRPGPRWVPQPERGASVREVTGSTNVHDVLLPASHSWDSSPPLVSGRCDSGAVTTLHPVRPAVPSGAATVLPGADLLASVLAGTEEDERPVTHVHHVP